MSSNYPKSPTAMISRLDSVTCVMCSYVVLCVITVVVVVKCTAFTETSILYLNVVLLLGDAVPDDYCGLYQTS